MKTRSPVLGYNHNVRYAGRLWHVQTEDSGVQNPHIFTHLFHDGTILATKRIDYDPSSEVGVVQKLMQAQHKAMLRDLKQGAFDDKIARFFGAPVVKETAREEPTDPGRAVNEFDEAPKTDPSIPDISVELGHAATQSAVPKSGAQPAEVPPQPQPAARPSTTRQPAVPPPPSTISAPRIGPSRPNLTPSRPAIPVAASRSGVATSPPARPAVTGIGGRRGTGVAHPYGGGKPTAEGVVVARPAVIVGGDPNGTTPRASPNAPRPAAPPHPQAQAQAQARPGAPSPGPQPSKTPTAENIFGADLISEKSLDEVILAYLSEDLNEK